MSIQKMTTEDRIIKLLDLIKSGTYKPDMLLDQDSLITKIASDLGCEKDVTLALLGHLLKFHYIEFNSSDGIKKIKDFQTIKELTLF